jgi:hypothetical protein
MDTEMRNLLTQAINASYKDLEITSCKFDSEEEYYKIDIHHKTTEKTIRISLRDTGKKRDFDVIPLQIQNAPLGLVQIFTTFLMVFWHAQDNCQTMKEALIELASDQFEDDDTINNEKLVQ